MTTNGNRDDSGTQPANDVDVLLRNAQLREAIEPYADESLHVLSLVRWTTEQENEFLEAMLEWETAPVLPIRRWFEPELELPHPNRLSDEAVSQVLYDVLSRLCEKKIVLERTDHLSDRQLYVILYRDILPSPEKHICRRDWLCWRCVDEELHPEIWLTYYATERERRKWAEETGKTPPPRRQLPFPRRMPQQDRPRSP